MKLIALILLGLLVAWWGVLTLWVMSCHRDRVRAAATITPEEFKEGRKLTEDLHCYHMRRKDYVITAPFMIPFILCFLPCYLYTWFVPDPFKKHEHTA